MKENRLLTVMNVVCAVFLVLFLICSILCGAVAAMFDVSAVQKRLENEGIYDFAMQKIEENLNGLQGVIGVETDALMEVITPQTVEQLLSDHIRVSTENLFTGTETASDVSFTDDKIYALVCDAITKEQYNGDLTQMEEDRKTAYAELTDAVNEVLSFFPQTLYTSAKDILNNAGVSSESVYFIINMIKTAALPILLFLTVLAAVGVFFCSRDRQHGFWNVAGCTFLTTSVFFLISVFMRNFSLIGRLSLTDGLLRRYILAVISQMGDAFFTAVTVPFVIGTVLLIAAITWRVCADRKTSCKMQETVIE